MNYLIKNFLRGLVIVVPVAATVYVLYAAFVAIDRILGLEIPGLGALIIIASVILIGILASTIAVRSLLQLMDALFVRAPFVKIVYSAIKDLVEAFAGDRKRFNHPVLVRFSSLGGAAAVGFLTREDLEALGIEGKVAVYFPQSYNFAGNLLLVDRAMIEPLQVESSRAMAFVVSGGVSGL